MCLGVHAQKTYVVSVGIADYKEINDLHTTIERNENKYLLSFEISVSITLAVPK